ncbi:MAG: hypothetical protein DHS20C03_20300 [Minwuia thermotolerans]|nr:MAG: hypothetical protein DHS20C03_20300 [Minwuia thermotolerans]
MIRDRGMIEMADDKRNTDMIAYQKQIAALKSTNQGTRLALARDADARPEVLYYLAEDQDKDVRSAVASNPATPGQADLKLSEDVDPYVRTELARKIGRLLPGIGDAKQERLRDLTEQALDHLSADRLVDVRAALADAIRDSEVVPKAIVMKLAQDVEEIVAAPILEYSPLLNDADLVEIIAAGVTIGALPSIARRRGIGPDVADAVVATTDLPAVAALLHNRSAQVRSDTLDELAEDARDTDVLHEPLVMRPELSQRAIRRISTFVARSLLDRLAERGDLDNRTRQALAEAVGEKLSEDKDADQKLDSDFAEHLHGRGKLDDEVIQKAMEKNRRSFVIRALALKAGRKEEAVERIMAMRNGKATTALVHQAGLSMRTALLVQQRIARVPPHELLAARNGVDYPMTPEELEMQIAHIG